MSAFDEAHDAINASAWAKGEIPAIARDLIHWPRARWDVEKGGPEGLQVLRDWLLDQCIEISPRALAFLVTRWELVPSIGTEGLDLLFPKEPPEPEEQSSDLRDLAAVLAHTGPRRLRVGRFEIQPDVPAGAATLVRWNDGAPRSGVRMPINAYPIPESHRDEGWLRWLLQELLRLQGSAAPPPPAVTRPE